MQRRGNLPSHPSLPRPPNANQFQHNPYQQPVYFPVVSAPSFGNAPYPYQVSSHYAQAYTNQYAVPTNSIAGPSSIPSFPPQPPPRWAQPGGHRCKKPGCTFTGSQKSVETHMMDRHLIYPPGWDKRKQDSGWDADPSLKGKPVLIQGTTVKLDTPEEIEKWIADRKKRFPTAERVQDKQQKMDEAVARGQLPLEGGRFPKRRKLDHQDRPPQDRSNQRGRGRGRGRGQGRGDFTRAPPLGRGAETARAAPTAVHPLPPKPPSPSAPREVEADPDSSGSGSDSDSDGAPEVVSSKLPAAPDGVLPDVEMDDTGTLPEDNSAGAGSTPPKAARKPQPKQPRRPPHNPFATRPALLRNLLLPEIRMTISNLSQTIRFLVDNDFLDNVELKPGQADEKMIEVIESTTDEPTVDTSSNVQII